MRYLAILFLIALAGCVTLDDIKDVIPQPEEPTVKRIGGDELLAQIEAIAEERTENTPDVVDVEMRFDSGDVVTFQIRNKNDAWLGGNGFNANRDLRWGIFDVIGEGNARRLGGDQLRRGEPTMPPISLDGADVYYWRSADGKKMYEINNVNVYAIRVVERLKDRVGATGTIIEVSGNIRRYR